LYIPINPHHVCIPSPSILLADCITKLQDYSRISNPTLVKSIAAFRITPQAGKLARLTLNAPVLEIYRVNSVVLCELTGN